MININPSVSIILPTYNRYGYFLERAVQSVIRQSYKNWELIVVDNNSSDGTLKYLKSIKNNNISILSINNDGNIARSRNLGIKNASGDFIAFLDSDDFWEKDKLLSSISFFNKNHEYVGVCHSEYWLSDDIKNVKNYGPESNYKFDKLLTRGNCISLSAVILQKKCLKDVGYFSEDVDIITAEDYDLWLKISKLGKKIGFLTDILGNFQLHSTSESSNIIRNTKAVSKVLNKHINQKDIGLYAQAQANCWTIAGKCFYKEKQIRNAFMAYCKALQFKKINPKVYIFILLLLIPYGVIRLLLDK